MQSQMINIRHKYLRHDYLRVFDDNLKEHIILHRLIIFISVSF